MATTKITNLLGDQEEYYLGHTCTTIDKSLIHAPSPNIIDEVWNVSDRNIPTLNNLQRMLNHGRLAGTGYLSILPVDQYGRSIFRSESALFRSGKYCQISYRRRMQRCCVHIRRIGRSSP